MAGYSGTPLPKKLGIKDGHRVAVLGAPGDFPDTLGQLPLGVSVDEKLGGRFDVIVLFAKSKAELVRSFGKAKAALLPDGGLWIAWPKKASGVQTDVTEDIVRADALASGLVDNKVCAIDDTWSGLRLVYRVADRAAVAGKRTSPAPPVTKRTTKRASPASRRRS
jgi:hypothetical protein